MERRDWEKEGGISEREGKREDRGRDERERQMQGEGKRGGE